MAKAILNDKEFRIDWEDKSTYFFLNPKISVSDRHDFEVIFKAAPYKQSHIWVQSSGSSQSSSESCKWIALSKEAVLTSAQAVNDHLDIQRKDSWGLALPLFHVGGLAILARAHLGFNQIHMYRQTWDATHFYNWLIETKVSILSLVPTQLFDLVQQGFRCPPSLRCVVIGGAKLEAKLAQQAWVLNWPVLASFGMTELGSQIATAKPGSSFSDDLILLRHIHAKVENDGYLQLQSAALMTGYAQIQNDKVNFFEPFLVKGFWKCSDQAQLKMRTNLKTGVVETVLAMKGRVQDFIKVKGEGVNLTHLRSRFFDWLIKQNISLNMTEFAVVDLPHPRDGVELILVTNRESQLSAEELCQKWNQTCPALERLRSLRVEQIPISALGKVQYEKLRQLLK